MGWALRMVPAFGFMLKLGLTVRVFNEKYKIQEMAPNIVWFSETLIQILQFTGELRTGIKDIIMQRLLILRE